MMPVRVFALLLVALCLGLAAWAPARADEPAVTRIEPVVRDGQLEIDADVDMDLNDQLREAAQRGVSLYFTADLVITRERWWWFDSTVVETEMTWRVTYNALTRQWRVGAEELSLPVATLAEAMSQVRRIRGWKVAPSSEFDRDTRYEGRLRVRLDTSQLARPFQVNALNSSSWSLATPWAGFSFAVSGERR